MTDRSGKQIDLLCEECRAAYATHYTDHGRHCNDCASDLEIDEEILDVDH